jgi:hypothetical protein
VNWGQTRASVENQVEVLRAQAKYHRGEAQARDELADELLAELKEREENESAVRPS